MKCAGTGTATFKNSMRLLSNNTQFFRMNSMPLTQSIVNKSRLWLELTNEEGGFKQLLVGYVPEATNGFDSKYDGELTEAGNPVSFYSILNDKKLSIQGRALPFVDNDLIPLGYNSPSEGYYTIQLATFDGFFDDQNIYLEDKLLNIVHNLKNEPYIFFTESGTFESRFILRYTDETLSVTPFDIKNVVVIKNNQQISVLASTNTLLEKIILFDMRGRKIATKENIQSNATTFENLVIANQVLLVQITDESGNSVTKKIIF
ncbi:T9SS sorting signal type C domain-containing protein [Flavobacterium piscinae]|nr:T9SS sorting signal type C domain-containing protein [Flavobacterium piscinae]MBC8884213.1 T9SS sorting signal type C domain-containing protein [Flavobacterium piscinae]